MDKSLRMALFYCQHIPFAGQADKLALEKEYRGRVRLFPLPCSGRIESLHLLKALEELADLAYVATCPEGHCAYFEGNRRARKRVEKAREMIASIGLEPERVGIVVNSRENPKGLAEVVTKVLEKTMHLHPSPVLTRAALQ